MDTINRTVSENIKRLRKEKGLSLDELANLSSVSKSMLAQIERGNGNPTLSTLWKIAGGMQISFNELVMREEEPYTVLKLEDIDPVLTDDGNVRNYPLFTDDEKRRFSIYHLEIAPGASWTSEPHLRGTVEYVTVYRGTIEITASEKAFTLNESESLRFHADTIHSYRNPGKETAVIHNILSNTLL